ncbi:imidazole glycerol phosphate synthase subunit HisF [Trueperella bialowiezensis]|uniref:Imidazole glycerol phosphate synthase subunit HisF n=1 Tax=Trueperella bialowiezensis TaxID=312285 RepID=A0A3S4YWH6_9ACTO|nr:imidazole glycerol phosphate synthase subunit HisF [Trueperella bialowiezensis]VEI12383.1 Imidazole glycerol phosphate synthase subunit HisF [Trueperella bialowiezensis]
MSTPIRIIPCLDISHGRVVKGVNFAHLKDAGDPVELAARYSAMGADEITFLDISASVEGRGALLDVLRKAAGEVNVPLTIGGGVRSVDDVRALLGAGANKVGINTAALARPELITEVAEEFGGDVVTLSVDARRESDMDSGFGVTTHGGTRSAGVDAVEWAVRAAELGAGEILLNSMDADGTTDGFDIELISKVRDKVSVSLIASGGAGTAEHFVDAARAGADAVLAASVFHFGTLTVADVKEALAQAGFEVRL